MFLPLSYSTSSPNQSITEGAGTTSSCSSRLPPPLYLFIIYTVRIYNIYHNSSSIVSPINKITMILKFNSFLLHRVNKLNTEVVDVTTAFLKVTTNELIKKSIIILILIKIMIIIERTFVRCATMKAFEYCISASVSLISNNKIASILDTLRSFSLDSGTY